MAMRSVMVMSDRSDVEKRAGVGGVGVREDDGEEGECARRSAFVCGDRDKDRAVSVMSRGIVSRACHVQGGGRGPVPALAL
eukprot:1465566-Rhodomonas_salina.1